jgi:hypothetical protein
MKVESSLKTDKKIKTSTMSMKFRLLMVVIKTLISLMYKFKQQIIKKFSYSYYYSKTICRKMATL